MAISSPDEWRPSQEFKCINEALNWLYDKGYITKEERNNRKSERLKRVYFSKRFYSVSLKFNDDISFIVYFFCNSTEIKKAVIVYDGIVYIYDKDGYDICHFNKSS